METQGCTLGGPSGAAATCAAPHQSQGSTTNMSSGTLNKASHIAPSGVPPVLAQLCSLNSFLICSISGNSCATALQVLSFLRLLLSQPFSFSHVQLHSYFYLCATALQICLHFSMGECFFLSVPMHFSTYFFTWIRNYDCFLEWVKFLPQGNPVLNSQKITLQELQMARSTLQ